MKPSLFKSFSSKIESMVFDSSSSGIPFTALALSLALGSETDHRQTAG
jgi:hypothetical protein